jgi:hypothetical protein
MKLPKLIRPALMMTLLSVMSPPPPVAVGPTQYLRCLPHCAARLFAWCRQPLGRSRSRRQWRHLTTPHQMPAQKVKVATVTAPDLEDQLAGWRALIVGRPNASAIRTATG